MGRTRSFEEPATLRAAAEVFRSSGYEGTSVDDLVTALNLHRGSLYNAYGSKRGLFLATLRHHLDLLRAPADGPEGGPPPPADAERTRALDLLLIAAVERGPVDLEVAELVRAALHHLDGEEPGRVTAAPAAPAGPALSELGQRLVERLTTRSSPRD